jgi:predicted nuclease with RNAse H fold
MTVALGLHLQQGLDLVGTPRPSVLVAVDAGGRLVEMRSLGDDGELLAALPAGEAPVAVDAPLAVPNETGRRDVETLLAWLDVPVLPASRRRLHQLHGGLRGETLLGGLAAGGRPVAETVPDLVLRVLAWERDHAPGAPAMDLGAYRAAWLGMRAPRYRPKGAGRAHPAGMAAAHALLAGALDLGGWAPHPAPDDWRAIEDAARLDALACAVAAHRLVTDPARCLVVGGPDGPALVAPADPALRARAAVNLERLRAEGAVGLNALEGPSSGL